MAKSNSGQKFIARNRPPRVQIEYVDPTSDERVELPFVMGVLADLSGNSPGHGKEGFDKGTVADRKFLDIDMDNFDERMGSETGIRPGVSFHVQSKLSDNPSEKLSVKLDFKSMADFSPAAVAKQVPVLAELLEARQRLANLRAYIDGKDAANQKLRELLKDPQKMQTLREFLAAI
ncbi:type VI secretion system contractile sheath small subunit [Beijerinckia mobilis]|uniref:type VI secretion system contractile sheath small subunit n=1 Tax=Beijerinckia mobilis TaxID=231434 RepID=UPI000A068E14|nr:type VI secretion system contractile sheath small subunit [Beijerinckia mobilis]